MSFREINGVINHARVPIRINRKYPNIVKVNNIPVKYILRTYNKNRKNDKTLVYESGEISDASLSLRRTSVDVGKRKYNNPNSTNGILEYLDYIEGYTAGMRSYFVSFHAAHSARLTNPLLFLRVGNYDSNWDIVYTSTNGDAGTSSLDNTFNYTINNGGDISDYIYQIRFYDKILEVDNDKRIMYYIKPKYLRLANNSTSIPKIGSSVSIKNTITINPRDKPDGGKYNYILRDNAKSITVSYTVKELEWRTTTGTRTPPGNENNDSYTEDIYTREEKYVDGQPTGEYRNETITGSNRITWKDEIEDRVGEENRENFGPGYHRRYRGFNKPSKYTIFEGKVTESYTKITYRDYKKRKYKNDISTNEVRTVRTEVVKRESVYWKMEYVDKEVKSRYCGTSSHGDPYRCHSVSYSYYYIYGEVEYINDVKTGNIRNKVRK